MYMGLLSLSNLIKMAATCHAGWLSYSGRAAINSELTQANADLSIANPWSRLIDTSMIESVQVVKSHLDHLVLLLEHVSLAQIAFQTPLAQRRK